MGKKKPSALDKIDNAKKKKVNFGITPKSDGKYDLIEPEKKEQYEQKVQEKDTERMEIALQYIRENNLGDLTGEELEGISEVVLANKDGRGSVTNVEKKGLSRYLVHAWMMYGESIPVSEYRKLMVKRQKQMDPNKMWSEEDPEYITEEDIKSFFTVIYRQPSLTLQRLFTSKHQVVDAVKELVDKYSFVIHRIGQLHGLAEKLKSEGKIAQYMKAVDTLNKTEDLYHKYTKEIKQVITVQTLESHLIIILEVIRDCGYLSGQQKQDLMDDINVALRKSSEYFDDGNTVDATYRVK
jgi:ribosomal protein S8